MAGWIPVTVVSAGGLPVINLPTGAPATVTDAATGGIAITIVTALGTPMSLFTEAGAVYGAAGSYVPTYYFLGF